MRTIRINEALARAENAGRKVYKYELAAKLWPDMSPQARQVNMTRLCTGKTKRIQPSWVGIICRATGVDANFLFGLSD